MHFGKSNKCGNYAVNGIALRNTDEQQERAVQVDNLLKGATHVEQ